ncbi:hypothetical protein GGR95_002934 [Sulfitobacter undariae]|uniref:Uncharacterized protein n=1 Tax=Sulfitobacter undariae TaxID=1563671 RepID=A0A7W6ECJ1_9RHOB|nr:hypothetical protein [Sulfitobacter undariae]MBB3995279.1 hypothetical protein [Sulfitobacter undariae]
MKPIGIIEPDRLKLIPRDTHAAHEFCFHLHDTMGRILVQMERKRAGDISFNLASEEEARLLQSGIHPLDFLSQTGRSELERRAVVNHVTNALYADMLHFIYEALRALEKRKFTVAFALLRKPLTEGLLVVCQACANEADFFDNLKTNAANLTKKKRFGTDGIQRLIESAVGACRGTECINPETINSLVFDRDNSDGLANLFDKALHLATGAPQLRTENYNINFIFKDPTDDDIYTGSTYQQIATVLLFLNLMQIELYSRMHEPNRQHENWLLFTATATFQTLFSSGRSSMVRFVNQNFKEFLECPTCGSSINLRKAEAPRLFIGETLECRACETVQHFPFGWLLHKLELDLFDRGS